MFDNYPGLENISISFTDVAGGKHCDMESNKTGIFSNFFGLLFEMPFLA